MNGHKDKGILLINPAVNPASQNKVVNAIITTVVPTSLASLAAFLIKRGIDAFDIVDEQIDYINDSGLARLVGNLKEPRIVGISTLTITSKRAYDLAARIKKIDPRVIVVLGGIHPTVLPEEALRHDAVDVVVRGEGEETFEELIGRVAAGRDYGDIKGISVRKNGRIAHNPDRPLIANLDDIGAFPYHLFKKNIDRYHSFSALLTSRGCPYGCTFCSSRNISGRTYRYHSIERVLADIALLADTYGQKVIWFMDDNPAADPRRFMSLIDAVMREGLHKKVEFHGSMRGDNLNEEMLKKARQANFRMIAFGLETTSETLMKEINKGETVKQVFDAI
ncbi:MAG: radical SAM protein, partial [Candidatus Omnitrophica bacterium]|nr:radical SAM protein [Candidatus Omnitrophota bacterium]